ncbi:MAG: Heavy metal efflux outer membrane protein CzcC family [Myxococcaceae bacterium]|nr:Heavy metal efflux outer membrane protein CzcC family [Myxococcaceae bacterium]
MHSDRDRAWVAQQVRTRQGTGALSSSRTPAMIDALLADGLDEDEAVALALANNPAYQADLSRIDSARADLDEARRPANPQIGLLDAIGPVSAMATLLAPLDSLWQLSLRSKLAARTLESVAESLVQTGLDLARDTKLAHAARVLAEQRLQIRRELVGIWQQLSEVSEQRVELGEAAPSEALSLRAEAALARDLLAVSESELSLARAQLRTVLGLSPARPGFDLRAQDPPLGLPPLQSLERVARQARPDVRAAELSLLAAGARLGWERSKVLSVALYIEGHWTRPDTYAARLGGRVEVPLFGANPGGRGRARAELLRASAALSSLRQRVLLEVLQAHTSGSQSRASLVRYRDQVLPALDASRTLATQAYELGEETYVVVLDLMRRSGEARLREAELMAQTRRADAELERAVGARIGERR